jgi:hypothetical protein
MPAPVIAGRIIKSSRFSHLALKAHGADSAREVGEPPPARCNDATAADEVLSTANELFCLLNRGQAMPSIVLRTVALAPLFIGAALAAPPPAGAVPTGPCERSSVGRAVADAAGYSLCTGSGWVHVDAPLKPQGECARLATIGPHDDGTYTICTNQGWVDVNRPLCGDFPAGFNCDTKH